MTTTAKSTAILLALLVTTLGVTACSTMHGFGEDIEKVGEQIQEEAN